MESTQHVAEEADAVLRAVLEGEPHHLDALVAANNAHVLTHANDASPSTEGGSHSTRHDQKGPEETARQEKRG